MGFLRHLLVWIFVALAVSVGAFAVAVKANNPNALEAYENHVKEPLESMEFVFTLIGLLYFVLPMLAFAVVNDWSKTFFDCFSPMTLWMDVIFSSVVILHFIVFLGDIEENVGRIMTEYEGMGLLLSCVYVFVMLKASNDANFNNDQANTQSKWALLFLVGFGLATLLQLQFQFVVPAEGYSNIAYFLALLGVASQAVQPLLSVLFLIIRGVNFENDDESTWNIKVCAAALRVTTLSYDVWLCHSKGWWKPPDKKAYAGMQCACLVVSCFQLVYRYLGPQKLKEVIVKLGKLGKKLACLVVNCFQFVYRYLGPQKVKEIFVMLGKKLGGPEELEEVRRRSTPTSASDHIKTLNLRVLSRF